MTDGPVVTDTARQLVGTVIERSISDPISAHHLRQYLTGTNDRNPAYRLDTADGERALTPPLFFMAALRDIVYRSDLGADGQHLSLGIGGISGRTVEGGTDFELHLPVRIGDVITLERRLQSVDEKSGRNGPLVVVVTASNFTNQLGEVVAELRHTLIFR
jgi:hydroxyacyl-ACP dehydratase HTD2-like protein with hotdog domain